MRRRWIWPLVALAVALAVVWLDGRLSPPKPEGKPVPRGVPLRDVPMTIGPAKPEGAPADMAPDAPPTR